jgi:hypothetical protein
LLAHRRTEYLVEDSQQHHMQFERSSSVAMLLSLPEVVGDVVEEYREKLLEMT